MCLSWTSLWFVGSGIHFSGRGGLVPELLEGADIAHRNARLRENERTMFEV